MRGGGRLLQLYSEWGHRLLLSSSPHLHNSKYFSSLFFAFLKVNTFSFACISLFPVKCNYQRHASFQSCGWIRWIGATDRSQLGQSVTEKGSQPLTFLFYRCNGNGDNNACFKTVLFCMFPRLFFPGVGEGPPLGVQAEVSSFFSIALATNSNYYFSLPENGLFENLLIYLIH